MKVQHSVQHAPPQILQALDFYGVFMICRISRASAQCSVAMLLISKVFLENQALAARFSLSYLMSFDAVFACLVQQC